MKEYKRDKRVLIPRDEFEEEASEGLGGLSSDESEADLRELKARMEGRLRRPRAVWLPAAAAVALLLVASAVVVSLLREKPAGGPEMAEAQAPEETTFLDTAYIAMAGPIEKADYPSSEEVTTARFVPPLVQEAADDYELLADADTGAEYMAEELVADLQAREEPVVIRMVAEEEEAEEVVVEVIPQAMASARKARAATETREATAARDEKKAVAAKEVAEKAEPAAGENVPEIRTSAAPLGGWDKYESWAERNIRYPEGVQNVLRQEVVVSFRVQPDSTLTDLKAVSSPGEPFTREAFRLLREGPKWVPAGSGGKAVAESVVVKVVFK